MNINRLPKSTTLAFIGLGAGWGSLCGVITGLVIAVPVLLIAAASLPVVLATAAGYALAGATIGALLGALHGGFVAFITPLIKDNPASRVEYQPGVVLFSVLLIFTLVIMLIFQGNWSYNSYGQLNWATGLVAAAVLSIAGGFIGHKIAGWYLAQESSEKKKKGAPLPDASHLSLDEALRRLDNRPVSDEQDSERNQRRH